MKLQVIAPSGAVLISQLDMPTGSTVDDLKRTVANQFTKFPVERQRLTVAASNQSTTPVVLKDGVCLAGQGTLREDAQRAEDNQVTLKDLGPQIGYRTVFLVEYAGPLLLYPLFSTLPALFAGRALSYDAVQMLALYCWSGHFLKRLYETVFVHRFSNATMPLFNLYKNCSYYWSAAVFVGFFVNLQNDPPSTATTGTYLWLVAFVLCELGNLKCHLILSNLRPPGTRVRAIPRGFLFELVSCPNYTCEILAWLCFSLMTGSWSSLVFCLVGAVQMHAWAKGKHARYLKEFNGSEGRDLYPSSRKVLIPFVL